MDAMTARFVGAVREGQKAAARQIDRCGRYGPPTRLSRRLALLLRRARTSRGWSRERVALEAEVPLAFIVEVEAGREVLSQRDGLERVGVLLGVEIPARSG